MFAYQPASLLAVQHHTRVAQRCANAAVAAALERIAYRAELELRPAAVIRAHPLLQFHAAEQRAHYLAAPTHPCPVNNPTRTEGMVPPTAPLVTISSNLPAKA